MTLAFFRVPYVGEVHISVAQRGSWYDRWFLREGSTLSFRALNLEVQISRDVKSRPSLMGVAIAIGIGLLIASVVSGEPSTCLPTAPKSSP